MKYPIALLLITGYTMQLSAQNVGIDVPAPFAKLQILQTGTTPGIRLAIENPASIVPGVYVVSNASGGPIEALNTHPTAKLNGVTGYVNSAAAGTADNGVTGVLGVAGAGATGIYAAGVRGVSDGNINSYGVVGYHSNGGIGVLGISLSGTGVQARSYSNLGGFYGLAAEASNSSVAILAKYSGSVGGALRIDNGSVSVTGVNRFAFVHTATAGNISTNSTLLDHPFCNGKSDAILYVTHLYGSSSAAVTINSALGVRYDSGLSKWRIFMESGASLPAGATFNVMVINN